MKVSLSMCGPHEDNNIIFDPVRHFGWQSFSTPLYHKLFVALIFLFMSLLHALSQHSVTRTKNFLSRAHPECAGTRNPRGLTRPAQDSNRYEGLGKKHKRLETFHWSLHRSETAAAQISHSLEFISESFVGNQIFVAFPSALWHDLIGMLVNPSYWTNIILRY